MSEWPRFYFLDEELQWLLAVRPEDGKYTFVVARDGWMLLEAQFEISNDLPYEDFIQHFLADLRTEPFHRKFHEVAKEYAPGMRVYMDCTGDCPWACKREVLMDRCFDEWSWRIPHELRQRGCRMFLHDDAMMAEATKA